MGGLERSRVMNGAIKIRLGWNQTPVADGQDFSHHSCSLKTKVVMKDNLNSELGRVMGPEQSIVVR